MNEIITYKAENKSEEINCSTNKALAVLNLRMMSHIGRPGLVGDTFDKRNNSRTLWVKNFILGVNVHLVDIPWDEILWTYMIKYLSYDH